MSKQRRADILLLSVTFVWGSTFVITKGLMEDNSPFFYCAIRFLLATLILYLPFYRRFKSIPRKTVVHGTVLGLLLYVGFVVQTIGIKYTTASKAAFFTGMLVPLTPIVHQIAQRLFHAKRQLLKIGNLVGVICAGIGLYLLTSPAGSAFNLGDALNLLCALFFACFIVYLDSVPAEVDKLQMTLVQFFSCGLAGLICALVLEEVKVTYTFSTIGGFLYLTLIATVITMWIQNRFQGDTTPTRAAVIFAMEPVVAAIFAYFVRGEIIGTVGAIGGVIIVGGLLLSEFSEEIPFLKKNLTLMQPSA